VTALPRIPVIRLSVEVTANIYYSLVWKDNPARMDSKHRIIQAGALKRKRKREIFADSGKSLKTAEIYTTIMYDDFCKSYLLLAFR